MKRFLLIFVLVAVLAVAGHATDALYHNIGTVICDDPPQVDASVFLNDGSFCAQIQLNTPGLLILIGPNTTLPYTTQNTLWFTNNNIMQAGPGFQLDYITDDGIHHPAASIVNSAGGANGPANIFGTQFVLLSATNMVNKGLLEVGSFGLMQLSGQNLNLARGGLLVDAASGGGACIPDTSLSDPNLTPTNFFPFSGIVQDDYWGAGTVTNLASDQIVQQRGASIAVQSPFHAVTNNFGFGRVRVGPLASPATFVRTNSPSSTNSIVQAIFVGSSFGRLDSNVTTQVRFVDNTYPDNNPSPNGFRTAVVEFRSVAENPVTGQPIIYSLYLVDQLATTTNLNTITNLSAGTQRPAPYIVDIYPPCSFFLNSSSTNADFTNTMVYSSTFSNRVVTANYAGYEAFLAAPTGGGTLSSNTPGRIDIEANNLDLTGTRIRGESIVSIKTPHLVGSSGLIVDAPNINYNIGSTNGLLSVSGDDLAVSQVQRFGGFINAWSGFWTNFASQVVTNIGPDPNDTNVPPMIVTNLATNTIEAAIHVLIVDAAGLVTTSPVLLNDFSASSTNIVLNDTVDAGAHFAINGDSLTVNGTLSLGTSDWASTNVHLKSLTNNGTIFVPDVMQLGDAARPYASVVNNAAGSLSAFSVTIDADFFQDSGDITAGAFLNLNTRSGKLEGGSLAAGNNLSISAQDLKMTGYQQSSATFSLAVTNSLTDAGAGASNTLTCNNGFNLVVKPTIGDLFGTTFQTQAGQFQEANHIWSAEDRGPNPAGFVNNAAIGHLIINAVDTSFVTFSGSGANNGLYVDFLDLRGAAQANLQSVLALDTNIVIYFADANVSAESLDGQFADAQKPDGRLRWVSSFAGPNSSVDILRLNGQTAKMNRALRFSTTIDSDGDGVPNGFDCYPYQDPAAWNCSGSTNGPGPLVTIVSGTTTRSVAVSWSALPSGIYQVEYTTNLTKPAWQPLLNYTNVPVTSGALAIQDPSILSGDAQRYYRLRFGQ
jgi:hypothetical protein